MKLYQKVLIIIYSLACLIFVLCFKTLPAGKLWKEYKVLYVSVDSSDSIVKNSISKAGINDYVSLSNQYLPVLLNENSPEISLFRADYSNEKYSYYSRRNAYFYDKSGLYRLYYIPSSYQNKLQNCLKLLSENKISAGVDSNSSYPFFIPLIVLLLSLFLCFFSSNRVEFAVSALLPVCFAFCNPFFSIAFAEYICLLSLFFISNIWKRNGNIKLLTSNYYILILILASIICGFGSSIKTGFFYILSLSGTCGFIFSYKIIEDYIDSRRLFVPVLIIPAKKKSLFGYKPAIIASVLFIISLFTLMIFFLSSSANINSHFAKILLPSAKGIESEKLPALNDYYDWMWNIKSAPYQSLNSTSVNQNQVILPRFKNENGKIQKYNDSLSYDENFKQTVYEEIDKLKFNAIEKVLKSENINNYGYYASSGSASTSLFGIISMVFVIFLLLFLFISIMIGKGIIK